MSVSIIVRSRIPTVTGIVLAKAAAATGKAAHDIEAQAKARAPVDTGALKNSINTTGGGLEWRVDSPVHYSIYQEYGTSRMGAHPYMTPAVEVVRPTYEAALRKLV